MDRPNDSVAIAIAAPGAPVDTAARAPTPAPEAGRFVVGPAPHAGNGGRIRGE